MLTLLFFFFNDTATTEIYTLSLHDALPIWGRPSEQPDFASAGMAARRELPLFIKLTVVRQIRFRNDSRSEEHTSELQSQSNLVCRLLLEKKKKRHKS